MSTLDFDQKLINSDLLALVNELKKKDKVSSNEDLFNQACQIYMTSGQSITKQQKVNAKKVII